MKVIAITGSTGGMGQNLCTRLAAKGDVALALCSNQAEQLEAQVKMLSETYNVPVYGAAFDIFEEEPVAAFFNTVEEKFGKVDVLFNLAGLSIPTKMESVKGEEFDLMYDVNVKGTLIASKHYALHAVEKGGLIVNIGSQAARKANGNAPLYCTAKAAVNMLSTAMQIQLAEKDIRVTTLNPGGADTTFWGTRAVDRSKLMSAEDVVDVMLFVLDHPRMIFYSVDFESATRVALIK